MSQSQTMGTRLESFKNTIKATTYKPLVCLTIALRATNAIVIGTAVYLILTGFEYCNPKCAYKFNCIDMTMQQWQAYEIDGQFVALAALIFLEGLVIVCLLLCPLLFVTCSDRIPVIVCVSAFIGSGCLSYSQAYFSACPWDDPWKNDLQGVRDDDPERYEEILEELKNAHRMSERDLFCLLYAPCRVFGWKLAAICLAVSSALFFLDALLTCRRQQFGFFGGHVISGRYLVYKSSKRFRERFQNRQVIPEEHSHPHDNHVIQNYPMHVFQPYSNGITVIGDHRQMHRLTPPHHDDSIYHEPNEYASNLTMTL